MSDVIFWLVVVLVGVFFAGWGVLIPWMVHRDQTKNYSTEWGYGNVVDFHREFAARMWEREKEWPESFFDDSTDSEIHASIVRFSGMGMVLDPLSWVSVSMWIRHNRLKVAKATPTIKWQQ